MAVKITLSPTAIMPKLATPGSSGYDLYAPDDVLVEAGTIVVIHSGVSIEMDLWMEGQVRGRSSMNKRGRVVLLGTIDSDYRGVIGATVHNVTTAHQVIRRGERFAQLVFSDLMRQPLVVVDELTPTERGTGGFGSTGV